MKPALPLLSAREELERFDDEVVRAPPRGMRTVAVAGRAERVARELVAPPRVLAMSSLRCTWVVADAEDLARVRSGLWLLAEIEDALLRLERRTNSDVLSVVAAFLGPICFVY